MYKAVILDFDGTVCDTGKGIKESVRYALDACSVSYDAGEDLSFVIGPPLLVMFQEHYGVSVTEAEELVRKYREHYTNTGIYESELYGGIEDMLISLKEEGLLLGIASSKPAKYVTLLLEKFNLLKYFDSVCGVDFKTDCEPKSSIIARCIEALGCTGNEVFIVGDRAYDISGAAENGADSAGVLWGYGNKFEFIEAGAKYIAEKPGDILAIAEGFYEQTEAVNVIFDGRILTVHNDDVTLCDGTETTRECVDHPGGVAVIGITDENDILLVRQFRYPYKETIYEIPAGKVEKGEDPFETGKREFREECGAIAENYFSLGEIYPSPGYTNEIIRLYGATGITFENPEPDADEFLTVKRMKLGEIVEKIMSGEIKDAKTVAAVFKLKEKLSKNDLS
ncbi:MAG: HAD hydrolase-like protein [Eubacterium sp.]|nr:HAD hydrolase-like protein [Eubacterium sp.]